MEGERRGDGRGEEGGERREGRGGEKREGRGEEGGEGRGGEEMELLPAAVAGTGVLHSEVAGSTVQPVREERRKPWKGCGEIDGRWECLYTERR